ncbi:MurR/RpiR family transcriptional regulator [bacterium D16-51]|nr:MurR/RpiR family transcriptional regulator [bacterium D16-59]RKI59080.1 MurR/RpiR family transcriptional regulator [bacterium D16-51]
MEQLLHYFQGTTTCAFEERIQEGAELIRDAEMVVFVGLGSSGVLARYGARYPSNFGKFSVGLEDVFYPLIEMTYPKIAVIVLSVSGETTGVIEALARRI